MMGPRSKKTLFPIALATLGILSSTSSSVVADSYWKADFVAYLDSDQTVPFEPNDASGFAWFKFNRKKTKLNYTIYLDGLDLDGFATQGIPGDDVTKIHFHEAPPGTAGPHILNVYKLPRQDDRDLSIKPFYGRVKGTWDDGDENLAGAPSIKLSDAIGALCSGNAYVNVHSVDHAPGVVRGQIIPTSRACRRLGYK